MEDKMKRQMELENEGVQLGIRNYRRAMEKYSLNELPPGVALMHRSIEPMANALEEFLKPAAGGGKLQTTRKFLREFDPVEVAFITARRLINAISEPGSLQAVAISLATMLVDHKEYLRFKEEAPAYLKSIEDHLQTPNEAHRRTVILRAKRKVGIEDVEVTSTERLHIGMKLIDLFIESTGLVKKERTSDEKSAYTIRGTDKVIEWITRHHAKCELMSPVYLPMIIKPIPWESPFGGGFLSNQVTCRMPLVKTWDKEYLERLTEHPMPQVYRAVNTLQNTPWRINRRVLEVMREVRRLDNGLAGTPMSQEEPLPPAPWSNDDEYNILKEKYPEVIKSWKRKATEVYERRLQNKQDLVVIDQKLWIAEKFLHEEEIYFVWTLDWRGRIYPSQPFVNPQSDDAGKALLEFAEGKELGHSGLRWLMIHLANKYGIDKVSFADRIQWVQDHHEDIMRWAEDPLTHNEWEEADSPWCFLAAVFEYAEVFTSGQLYAYESHLPIAMDGTCNGLQNFSAMLRDEVGGRAVNLVPSGKPQDVYQEVVNVVSKRIEEDAKNGEELAKLWVGKLDRSIAKRNVMTVPYGATLYGMKDQIETELRKRNGPGGKYLDTDDEFHPSLYLAHKMWDGIGEVVIAARNAMDWLQAVAKVVSKENLPLRWVTPAGFLVEQHYVKSKCKMVNTFWGTAKVRLRLSLNFPTNKLDGRKQAAGISPNFVHSMDASHLMLTVNRALDAGITSFGMIHDSYATHAADSDTLAVILRETFVEQYSEDVLQGFLDQIKAYVPDAEFPEVPPKGALDLEAVKDSEYFFA